MNFSEKIFSIGSDDEFEAVALELFRRQAERCAPYREYVELLCIDPQSVTGVAEIPFLPIELFKLRDVYCGEREPEKVFTSSSTTGQTPSRHMMQSLALYEQAFTTAFEHFYGAAEGWSIYGLLPNYLERDGSSLVYMVDRLIERCSSGGFYLFAPRLENTIVMETGGMKGRREELPKAEFHKILCEGFGVERIHSEYGMAELTSQAYSSGEGVFRSPRWMRVMVRDVNNPLKTLPAGARGAINIIDLANLSSCAFIATQDVGQCFEDGTFRIDGRLSGAEVRGCNLLIQ